MLRIIQNRQAAGAKSYYSTADYYSEGQELQGRWRGLTAARLGLTGVVQKPDWDKLCDNINPANDKPLTPRLKSDRTVGYDFNFHVPKSVSVLYAMTRDERILDAFRDAVDGTMQDIESEMLTRVRKSAKNENRTTGNMVWGEFIHFTARPVGGVPDPHLHAHCFAFNTTWDDQEKAFKAGQFRDLKRDAGYFEAVFHSRLAFRLGELGLPTDRTAKGWEIKGFGPSTIGKFSRRTNQIEELAKAKGIDDVEQKAELGAKTRGRKQKELTFPELQDEWRSRLSPAELATLDAINRKTGGDAAPNDGSAAMRAVEYAKSHAFERQSVVPERKLLTIALKHSVGESLPEQVLSVAQKNPFIRGEKHGQKMVSTPEVLQEEKKLVEFARSGRGQCTALNPSRTTFHRDWLNQQQKSAVKHIVESRDRVILLRGAAGVGKTTLMQEAVEAIQENGTKVFAFAPSSDASRGVLREAGFDNAETVAKLLVDQQLQAEVAGQVIWIDEAGLLGTKTFVEVVDIAKRVDARLLFSGDRKQHASVERGSPLALLEKEAGIVPAEVKEIKRQQGTYREAVRALSEEKTAVGFEQLDRLGWIKEIPIEERYSTIAHDYLNAIERGRSALVVSPTHSEGNRITSEIRGLLQGSKKLEAEEKEFIRFENIGLTVAERSDPVNLDPGDVLVYHQNAKGRKRGDIVEIGSSPPEADQAKHFQVYRASQIRIAKGDRIRISRNGKTLDEQHRLNNGSLFTVKGFTTSGDIVLKENDWVVSKDFGHIDYGYVVTSHASQGKSVDEVFIGQSHESFPASSREQFYVSVSRGAKKATIYTDDKASLKQAILQSQDRISATELHRQGGREFFEPVQLPDIRREEIIYDR